MALRLPACWLTNPAPSIALLVQSSEIPLPQPPDLLMVPFDSIDLNHIRFFLGITRHCHPSVVLAIPLVRSRNQSANLPWLHLDQLTTPMPSGSYHSAHVHLSAMANRHLMGCHLCLSTGLGQKHKWAGWGWRWEQQQWLAPGSSTTHQHLSASKESSKWQVQSSFFHFCTWRYYERQDWNTKTLCPGTASSGKINCLFFF
jgi:hypothetical protein